MKVVKTHKTSFLRHKTKQNKHILSIFSKNKHKSVDFYVG
ncbi:hypothetical protein TH70_1657 [Streptococcus agalactiae]|nr:hypothetical protein TH70_1657 [Streptococcus agalactiae]